MRLSPKQAAVLRHADGSVNILNGAIRSGKTVSANLRWLRFCAEAPPGQLAILGKTRDTIGRNVLAGIEDLHPQAISWRRGAPTCRIMGRTVDLIGANDRKAENKLRGATLGGALLDEATLVDRPFFETLLGRLSGPGAKLFATTNPDTPAHWLKTLYLDRVQRGELPGWRVWHFTMDDNPYLTDTVEGRKYARDRRREFTGLWFRRMILGEWVAAEGAVFDMWDPDVHVVDWLRLPQMTRLFALGVDYGTNNPTSAIICGIGTDGILYLVDEWRHEPALTGRWTDQQQVKTLVAWLNSPHLPPDAMRREPTVEWVAHDPSAASLRTEFLAQGVTRLMKANNEVLPGVQLMASLLHTGRLKVSTRCAGFITEAPGYSWDDDAAKDGRDQVVKMADHSLDAGRYSIASSQPLWRGLIRAA